MTDPVVPSLRHKASVLALMALAGGLALEAPVDGPPLTPPRARKPRRGWLRPPTVLAPVRAPCGGGEACPGLACPAHGAHLRKLARRAARALPAADRPDAAGDTVTMPAGTLPGVLGPVRLVRK